MPLTFIPKHFILRCLRKSWVRLCPISLFNERLLVYLDVWKLISSTYFNTDSFYISFFINLTDSFSVSSYYKAQSGPMLYEKDVMINLSQFTITSISKIMVY